MKLVSPEQLKAHDKASLRGSIEGAVGSGAVAVGISYWAHRRFPAYRALPLSLKSLAVLIIVVPCLAIQGERRGIEYDKSQWEGETVRVLDEKEQKKEARWNSLDTSSKIGDWAARHQYSLILGGWASSLGVAAAIISRDKYQTVPQKVVQARMWAQGLTIGIVIAAGALMHSRRAQAADHHHADHSWRDLLEQQERDKQEAEKARLLAGRPSQLHA
ncbi:hypothetical protein EYR40_004986 [Pleurotus pulmonarius]|nr:hypothetical protein EYR36_006637 [Pleurotus pulmonarius]KAF4601333.1 hypothetical protein EYR38_005985 [Pleurotus pulmonarius]KAF4601786.1 hypothetical protein EYR40_004986 [Pleurotus pulmonarius]